MQFLKKIITFSQYIKNHINIPKMINIKTTTMQVNNIKWISFYTGEGILYIIVPL